MNSFGLGVVLKFTDNFSVGVGAATTAFNGLSQAIDSQASGITNTLTSLCSTASSIGSQLTAAITTPVASIAGTFLQYGVARASFVENATLAYTTLMGDQKEASAYLQELMDFAKTTPFTYETIANTAQQFMAYGANMDTILKSVGDSGEKFTGILQALGDAAGGLGKGESFIAEASGVLMNMKTLIDSGSSTTVNFQQLESRGLQASKILGNLWNVENASAGTISAYIKENNISYEKFITDLTKGIEEGTDGVNGYTAAMSGLMGNIKNTWTGALDTWKSSLKTAGKNLMDYNEDTGTYGFLTDMTKALNICSNAVKTFSPLLQPLVDDIRNMMNQGASFIQSLIDGWKDTPQETKDIVSRVIEVLSLLGPALLIVGKAGGALSSVFNSLGGTLVKSLKFTFSPIGLMTGLLIGLVGAFIYLWQTSDDFRNHITSVFSGIYNSWKRNSEKLKESLGKLGSAFIDLFKNVTELLAPAFKGIFDTLGDSADSSGSLLIDMVNALASAVQWLSDRVKDLNEMWGKLPKSTQNTISGVIGKVALLATGFLALFKVLKTLKGASSIIDNIPFIGKKPKTGGGSSSNSILSNPMGVAKTMGSLAIIIGSAVLLVTAIGALESIPGFKDFLNTGVETIGKMFSVIIPLVSLVGSLSLLVSAMDKLKVSPTKCAEQFVDMSILLGGFTVLIDAIGTIQSIPGFSEFLSTGAETINKLCSIILPVTVITALLGLLVVAMDKLKVDAKAAALGIANVAIIIGGFDVLITAVGALASIPGFKDFVTTGTEVLTQMFTTMQVFTTPEFWLLCVAVTGLGILTPAIVGMGIAGVAIVIGGMGAIISAFGLLAQIPGFNDFLRSGGETLVTLFEQIGKIASALISSFLEGITDCLPGIADNLAQFGEKIKPFFESLQSVPTAEVGSFLVNFAEFMLMMTADQILSFFTGGLNLNKVGTELSNFGKGAKVFFNEVKNYPLDGIVKADLVFKALGGLGNCSFKTGGLMQKIVGETNLGRIGEQLSTFGTNAKTFFDEVKDYPQDGLDKAPAVFDALEGLGDYDFKFGGLCQFITGETNLGRIGEQLSSFGENAKKFFIAVTEYPQDGIDKAPKVFEALGALGNYEFKTGGLMQKITGEVRLDLIGTQLSTFATDAKDFFIHSGSLTDDQILRGKKVLEVISAISNYSFKSGGMMQAITGEANLIKIGEQLYGFYPNAKDYFINIGTLSPLQIMRGAAVLIAIQSLNNYSFKSGGMMQAITGGTKLTDIAIQLKDSAPDLKEFFTKMGELDDNQLSRGQSALKSLYYLNNLAIKSGGVLQWLVGKTALDKIGAQLASFAPNAKTFYTELGYLEDDRFTQGKKALGILEAIDATANKTNGLAQLFNGEIHLDTLGDMLGTFGRGIHTYLYNIETASEKGIEKAPKVIESLSNVSTLTDIASKDDKDKLSSLGSGLSLFMINGDTFFSRAADLNTSNSIVTLSEQLGKFLEVINKFKVDTIQGIADKINELSNTSKNFEKTLNGISTNIGESTGTINNAIVSCANSSTEILIQFANNGSVIGNNLMVAIAQGIYDNAWQIQNAVQYAINYSMPSSLPTLSTTITSNARKDIPHLASGGLATSPTVALIGEGKDDEGVFPLNDDTFKRLARGIVSQTATTNNVSNNGDKNSYDYSVTFEAGSIQFNLTGASDADLEQAAEKIEKIILRRQEIRKMANR